MKHVLASMPLHISMVLLIPVSVRKAIEKCLRKFLWSGSFDSRKTNFVKWEIVCLPKSEGGLGIHTIKELNLADFISLSWKAVSSSSLWASWIRGKYLKKGIFRSILNRNRGSCI